MSITLSLPSETECRTGDKISGEVHWKYKKSSKDKPVKVNLLYSTSGRGTKEVTKVSSIKIPVSKEKGEFSFTLEGLPPSFSGSLISIQWSIEAFLPYNKKVDRYDFTVSPTGERITLPKVERAGGKMSWMKKFLEGRR